MAVAGVGAAFVSGYFTVERLSSFMPPALALALGIIMVAFSVIAFELVLVFIQRRAFGVSVLFVGMWAIVWVFTLLSTVSGFYGYYSHVQSKAVQSEAPAEASRVQLEAVRQREADLAGQIAQKQKEVADLQRLVSQTTTSLDARTKAGWVYNDAQARILAREDQLTKLEADLEAARSDEATLIAKAPAAVTARRSDFFQWASSMLRIPSDSLELASSMFPSTFIDIISSVGLAVALFLR